MHNALPALIPEESEEVSINTEMCDDPERIESMLPLVGRPRTVRRMMLENTENTVIPWERYTTDNIVNTERIKLDKTIIKRNLRSPSIVFNPFQKDHTEVTGRKSPFLNIEDNRNRFFLSHISEQVYIYIKVHVYNLLNYFTLLVNYEIFQDTYRKIETSRSSSKILFVFW